MHGLVHYNLIDVDPFSNIKGWQDMIRLTTNILQNILKVSIQEYGVGKNRESRMLNIGDMGFKTVIEMKIKKNKAGKYIGMTMRLGLDYNYMTSTPLNPKTYKSKIVTTLTDYINKIEEFKVTKRISDEKENKHNKRILKYIFAKINSAQIESAGIWNIVDQDNELWHYYKQSESCRFVFDHPHCRRQSSQFGQIPSIFMNVDKSKCVIEIFDLRDTDISLVTENRTEFIKFYCSKCCEILKIRDDASSYCNNCGKTVMYITRMTLCKTNNSEEITTACVSTDATA